jgi:hypothetical protein
MKFSSEWSKGLALSEIWSVYQTWGPACIARLLSQPTKGPFYLLVPLGSGVQWQKGSTDNYSGWGGCAIRYLVPAPLV